IIIGDQDIYFLHAGEDLAEKIFTGPNFAEDDLSDDSDDAPTGENIFIRAVEIMEGTIYIVSQQGIFRGNGETGQWEEISSEGLILREVETLVLLDNQGKDPVPCVGGQRGVSCYLDGQWTSSSRGLGAAWIASLKKMPTGDLLASGNGVFILSVVSEDKLLAMAGRMPSYSCKFKSYANFEKAFAQEPSVREVQKMAIHYSDTDKEKIDAWHRQSRIKAFFPSFSFGIDRNTGELYHWDTGPNPDVLQKGRELRDWDARLSWNLSDVIWSTDQTSIDSRSKMMVELRADVLDQVTRLYFERRRLQIELFSCHYPSEGERMAAEMRVHEISAHIDAYTGGEFSRRLSHRSNQQPRRVQL
ncbi:MAG: hypothetical protein HQL18_03525, partial [Candidatus Omnitrophica bacterium]|nr:hypothetical protein [Candidatus Omnitrophota bacterium]